MGTFFSDLLPEWPMENLTLWLSLLQGLLLPLVLGLSDSVFAQAALLSCSKGPPKASGEGNKCQIIPQLTGGGFGK